MVENRKMFYAISFMLLTCCQIIAMLPHNMPSSNSDSINVTTPTSSNNNNSENKNAKILQETKSYEKYNNNNNDSDFLIIAAERTQQQKQQTIVSSEGVWETQENDSRPADNIDDLIFLDKRPINQHHQQQQHEKQLQPHQHQHHHQHQHQHHHYQQHHAPHHQEHLRNEQKHFEFQHIVMADGSSSNSNSDEDDTDSLTDTTYSSMIVVDDDDNDNEDVTDDGVPHEIELQPDVNEEVTPLNVTPLDLSDFLSLIPATKVKTIVNHYYHNDPEVQRAHAFMSSRDFLMLKQHIIAVPEMSAFLHYLNNSGLDLVKFVTALTNLTSYDHANTTKAYNFTAELNTTTESGTRAATAIAEEFSNKKIAQRNDIAYKQTQNDKIIPTISNIEIEITTNLAKTIDTTTTTIPATTMDDAETTTAKEQLNGLHGLVDSVLDVLPQDQILATFFDKLEANEQFSKLVDNIGSPEFAKILNNMQNSMPLRNLIFTLHNNGIYVIRIVDSLKSYFFLGGF